MRCEWERLLGKMSLKKVNGIGKIVGVWIELGIMSCTKRENVLSSFWIGALCIFNFFSERKTLLTTSHLHKNKQ